MAKTRDAPPPARDRGPPPALGGHQHHDRPAQPDRVLRSPDGPLQSPAPLHADRPDEHLGRRPTTTSKIRTWRQFAGRQAARRCPGQGHVAGSQDASCLLVRPCPGRMNALPESRSTKLGGAPESASSWRTSWRSRSCWTCRCDGWKSSSHASTAGAPPPPCVRRRRPTHVKRTSQSAMTILPIASSKGCCLRDADISCRHSLLPTGHHVDDPAIDASRATSSPGERALLVSAGHPCAGKPVTCGVPPSRCRVLGEQSARTVRRGLPAVGHGGGPARLDHHEENDMSALPARSAYQEDRYEERSEPPSRPAAQPPSSGRLGTCRAWASMPS